MGTMPVTEFYFLRLLDRTKRLIREDVSKNVHKATAAVSLLENMISKMKDENSCSQTDNMMQYMREVSNLQMLLLAEKQSSVDARLEQVEKIPKLFPEARVDVGKQTDPDTKKDADSAQVLRQRNTAVYKADLRKELLSSSKETSDRVEDEDDHFRKHEALEEELANELFNMTKSLKLNMQVANAVIKDDNKKLANMQSQVDKNRDSLLAEGDRLEKHSKKCGFDCMRLVLFVLIFYSFICMVFVMKIFPKRVMAPQQEV